MSNENTENQVDILKDSISQEFKNDGTDVTFKVEAINSPYSLVHILHATHRGIRTTYYAKTPKVDHSNETLVLGRLRSEFEIMRFLSQFQSDISHTGVAVPYALYPKFPTIITLAAKGHALRFEYRSKARILTTAKNSRSLLLYMELCGAWLKDFQDRTFQGPTEFDVNELLEYADIRLQILQEGDSPIISKCLAEKITMKVRSTAKGSALLSATVTGRHNDFASHNIIADQGRIRVIDFSMYDFGHPAYDACNFWLELEMLKCDWTYSKELLTNMQNAFLAAYGGVATEDPAFKLARVRYSLNRLLTAIGDENRARFDTIYRRRSAEVSYKWLVDFAHEVEH